MGRFARMARASIGAKMVMAVTGLLIFLWVIAHMAGNLLVFFGQDAMNAYALGLRELGGLLWSARIALLLLFVLHIGSALRVWRANRAARPEPYAVYRPVSATFAGRTMMVSGVLVLLYVIYHLLHFTLGVTNPDLFQLTDPRGRQDVYSMVVRSFSHPGIAGVYILSMVILAGHLSHGVSSLFQTLGLNHPAYNPLFKWIGPVSAVVIALGFISVPLAVWAGMLALP